MGSYRRAELALDAFRGFTARIAPKAAGREHISRVFSTGSSAPVASSVKFSGCSSSSSILHKSIPQLGRITRTTQHKSPFLYCTKRYYYVDRIRVHHFKPRGPRKWFENPRNVLIVGLVGSGFFITVFWEFGDDSVHQANPFYNCPKPWRRGWGRPNSSK
ncbi:hypothetical protein ACFXTH_041846 [Malus domestica]